MPVLYTHFVLFSRDSNGSWVSTNMAARGLNPTDFADFLLVPPCGVTLVVFSTKSWKPLDELQRNLAKALASPSECIMTPMLFIYCNRQVKIWVRPIQLWPKTWKTINIPISLCSTLCLGIISKCYHANRVNKDLEHGNDNLLNISMLTLSL